MASRTTDPAFAHLSLARAQGKSLLTMTYGAVSHRDLSQCCRCRCAPLLPATRGILAAHVYATPLCACAAAVHPSQQPQLAIVASRGSFRRVLSLRSSSNLARCKWNHRAARAWASCPTWCATSDGGGRPSINFSEVCSPPAQPTTVPAVALGAAGSCAASGTHVHPSCRVRAAYEYYPRSGALPSLPFILYLYVPPLVSNSLAAPGSRV